MVNTILNRLYIIVIINIGSIIDCICIEMALDRAQINYITENIEDSGLFVHILIRFFYSKKREFKCEHLKAAQSKTCRIS